MNEPCILYLSSCLPKLSETFVYREIFELRALGCNVQTASLHQPDVFPDGTEMQSLALETLVLYSGYPALLCDALLEAIFHPAPAVGTLITVLRGACRETDISPAQRLRLAGQAFAALALARRLRPKHITRIHAHMAHAPTTLAMYTAHQLCIPFSFTGHAADLFRDRVLLRRKLQSASFVACISYWHRTFYNTLVQRPDTEYPVVRCGVDPALFVADHSCSNQPLRLLAVGRLIPKKGFDILLRALKDLAEKGNPPVTCEIIGDGPEMMPLQALCSQLDLTAQVSFAGALQNDAIRERLKAADLFALPCRIDTAGDRDGIPVALMEAMCAETAVISGDLPAIRELISDQETGLLVEPENVKALSQALSTLLHSEKTRQTLAANARRFVSREFSSRHNAKILKRQFAPNG